MNATFRWGAAALALSLFASAGEAAPRARSYWVCVTNERSGDLTILDGSARRLVTTVPLGKRARGIHASSDGRFLYVALSTGSIAAPAKRRSPTTLAGFPDGRAVEGADAIAVIDASRRAVTRVLPTGTGPEDFAVSPDGTRLLVSHPGSSTVSSVRLKDGRVERRVRVDQGPEGVGVSPDGRTVLVACQAAGTVFAIDGRTGEGVGSIAVGGRPRAVAFEPDGSCAFVASESEGRLYVIETAGRKVTKTIALPGNARPAATVMSPDGKALYVTTGRAGTVCVIDPGSETVKSRIRLGGTLAGAALSPDGRTLYVADASSNELSIVDTKAGKQIARLPVGQDPWGVSVIAAPKTWGAKR